jgi:hypothetical protein
MPRDLDIASRLDVDDERPEAGLIALIHCIFFLLVCFIVATSFEQEAHQKEAPRKGRAADRAPVAGHAAALPARPAGPGPGSAGDVSRRG